MKGILLLTFSPDQVPLGEATSPSDSTRLVRRCSLQGDRNPRMSLALILVSMNGLLPLCFFPSRMPKWSMSWFSSNTSICAMSVWVVAFRVVFIQRKTICGCVVLCLVTQSCPNLCNPLVCSPPGSSHSPGKNTGVGCHALLQGTFSTQGSNPGLPLCRWILYHLSHQGSPRILEWIAYPFFRGTAPPRNQIGVSCTAGRFFTSWDTRDAPSVATWF